MDDKTFKVVEKVWNVVSIVLFLFVCGCLALLAIGIVGAFVERVAVLENRVAQLEARLEARP